MVASAEVTSIQAGIPATDSPSYLNIGCPGPLALAVTATAGRAP